MNRAIELRTAEAQTAELNLGQAVDVDARAAVLKGRVTRIDPTVRTALPEWLSDSRKPRASPRGSASAHD